LRASGATLVLRASGTMLVLRASGATPGQRLRLALDVRAEHPRPARGWECAAPADKRMHGLLPSRRPVEPDR